MVGAAERAIGIAPVLAEVGLPLHAHPFGNAIGAQVGIIGFDTGTMGMQVLKDEAESGEGGFCDVAHPLVILIDNVADGELGQLPAERADVDLADEFTVDLIEGCQEEAVARSPVVRHALDDGFGIMQRVDGHDGVARFVAPQVLLVGEAHFKVPCGVGGLVGTEKKMGGGE